MNRRGFLAGAGLTAGASVASALPKPAIAQDKTEWKMVTAWPKGMAGLGSGAERLADRIANLSGGRLTVKVLSAGELVPATQCLDAVSQGGADMAHDFAHYHLDKAPAAGLFSSVPFGLAPDEFAGWISFGGGQELWDELYAPFGVKPFPLATDAVRCALPELLSAKIVSDATRHTGIRNSISELNIRFVISAPSDVFQLVDFGLRIPRFCG